MLKKILIYITIGFLQLSFSLTKAYSIDIEKTKIPETTFEISSEKNKETGKIEAKVKGIINKEEVLGSKDKKEILENEDKKEDVNKIANVEEELANETARKIDEDMEKEMNLNSENLKEEIESGLEKDLKKTKPLKEKMSIPEYYAKQKTLMYKEDNFVKMIQILTSLESGKKYGEAVDDGKIVDEESLENILNNTTISVYLNSILYISDDLWSVWANGDKISNYNNEDSEIRVLSVTSERVKFLWSISVIKWEIMNANNKISEDVYTIKDDKVNMVFTLEPNQSFVPSMNEIIEGSLQQDEENAISLNNTNKNLKDNEFNTIIEGTESSKSDLFF